MRVKYLTCMAGDRETRNVGHVCDVGDEEAGRLIEAGFAVETEEETEEERIEREDKTPTAPRRTGF